MNVFFFNIYFPNFINFISGLFLKEAERKQRQEENKEKKNQSSQSSINDDPVFQIGEQDENQPLNENMPGAVNEGWFLLKQQKNDVDKLKEHAFILHGNHKKLRIIFLIS